MNKPTSIGPPFPIVEFSVREVENRDVVLPAGQRGELYIKSPLNVRLSLPLSLSLPLPPSPSPQPHRWS